MRLYESPHTDIELPALDLITLLFVSPSCAAKDDTKIHVEAANPLNYITKAEARIVVKRVAYLLRHRFGIGKIESGKDVVLSVCSGNPFIPVLVYSIIAAGGVYSGAPTSFTPAELSVQIRDADAKVLMCSPDCITDTIEAARRSRISLERLLVIHSDKPKDWQLRLASNGLNLLDLQNGPMLQWTTIDCVERLVNTTACLLYSSGTTGLPKGVRISHRNLVASTLCGMQLAKLFMNQQASEGSPFIFSMIAHLPMAHIGGVTWSSLYSFWAGGTSYWIDKYDFRSFIDYHRRYRLTATWTVPPIWLAIATSPDVTDHFDAVCVAVTGAAPLGPELAGRAARKLGKGALTSLNSLWGATETTGSMTGVDWDRPNPRCSVGLPFPNTKIRLVDRHDHDVEPGQPGEMLVSGPVVSRGYHNRPEANHGSFTDGFFRTGDIAVYQDGNFYVVDRLKDLIKYKGLQVAPAELEALLVSHPKIADAAVIGIQDDSRATEVPMAFIVSRGAYKITAEEVQAFVRNNLANHKHLRGGVVLVDDIPKSASGKILKKILRQRLGDGPRGARPKL